MITVEESTWRDFENDPGFVPLTEQYAIECGIAGLPQPRAKIDLYRSIYSTGLLSVIVARKEGYLIGFVSVLSSTLPHYGVVMSMTESLFVDEVFRNTGAGLKLLRAAEEKAKESGSPGLLVSAPTGGVLAEVLARMDYRETNRVFFKEMVD